MLMVQARHDVADWVSEDPWDGHSPARESRGWAVSAVTGFCRDSLRIS